MVSQMHLAPLVTSYMPTTLVSCNLAFPLMCISFTKTSARCLYLVLVINIFLTLTNKITKKLDADYHDKFSIYISSCFLALGEFYKHMLLVNIVSTVKTKHTALSRIKKS